MEKTLFTLVISGLLLVSCNNASKDDHNHDEHDHATHTHGDGVVHENHEHAEPNKQEEFVVSKDSITKNDATKSLESKREHKHEAGEAHVH